MADMDVRRQSAATIWWIFGIVALALLLWSIFGWDTSERGVKYTPASGGPVAKIRTSLPALAGVPA